MTESDKFSERLSRADSRIPDSDRFDTFLDTIRDSRSRPLFTDSESPHSTEATSEKSMRRENRGQRKNPSTIPSNGAGSTKRTRRTVHPIAALQTEYSLWTRDPEPEILPACRELGIAFVAYSPLGRGFLSGKIKAPEDLWPDDFRLTSPRFQGENFQRNLDVVERVHAIASAKSVTPAQLALRWVLEQGQDIVPIPGTKRRAWLEENVAALDIPWTPADAARIAEAAPKGAFAGTRYSAAAMRMVGR